MLVEGTAEAELRPLAESTLKFTKVPDALAPRFERLRAGVEQADREWHERQKETMRSVTVH